MKTMLEEIGLAATAGEVGIEIELEGENLPEDLKQWRCEHDGSLRGRAVELVLRKPVKRNLVAKALDEVTQDILDRDAEIKDSGRAGIHVHINIQELTAQQLAQFMCLYLCFEDILVRYCGEGRVGNLFCLRCSDAPYVLDHVRSAFRRHCFEDLESDEVRYASMNVKAVPTYGSLEFRAMRSTVDMDVIQTWVNILLRLKDKSKEYDDPIKIVENASIMGVEGFYDDVLGAFRDVLKFDGHDILNGVRNAQQIAYGVPNWEEAEAKMSSRVVFDVVGKEKDLGDILEHAQEMGEDYVKVGPQRYWFVRPMRAPERWFSTSRAAMVATRALQGKDLSYGDKYSAQYFFNNFLAQAEARDKGDRHEYDWETVRKGLRMIHEALKDKHRGEPARGKPKGMFAQAHFIRDDQIKPGKVIHHDGDMDLQRLIEGMDQVVVRPDPEAPPPADDEEVKPEPNRGPQARNKWRKNR